MKAEQRKELESNALIARLGRAYAGLKHGPSRGTRFFVGLAIVAALIGLAWWYFSATSATGSSARWLKLDEVIFPEQLTGFLQDPEIKDTPQARLGRFLEARDSLRDGLAELGSDHKKGVALVKQGTKLYEELLKESGRVPLLQQEALWGAAKGNEALGNLDKAKGLYARLEKEFPRSALGEDAARQLKRLQEANKQDLTDLAAEYGAKGE
jgi:hypothetical protein